MMKQGFTLAELLIALAILGVIATFTIPKVLQTQQNQKFNAIGKEAASMISGAYQAYQQKNTVTASTGSGDLTAYMNYVALDTTSMIDRTYMDPPEQCSATYPCLLLHSGARLSYSPSEPFAGTVSTSAIYFYLDPDGVVTTNGSGKSVVFFLYVNGRLTTWGNLAPGTYNSGGSYTADPNRDPSWLSWS